VDILVLKNNCLNKSGFDKNIFWFILKRHKFLKDISMSELTREYFDSHYKELIEFLGEQFGKVNEQFGKAAKGVKDGFAEQEIKLNFIQMEIASFKKDLAALSKRTKEDDGAFAADLLKLKNRFGNLEKEFKKFKVAHA